MNERIRELWEEAAKEPYGGTWEEHTAFMGKFAELIIRECADFLSLGGGDGHEEGKRLKRHFGVEE